MNLALVTGVLVLDLQWIKDVLPNVKGCVGVSESEGNEGRVNTDDALDVDSLLLDDMSMEGFVGRIAHFAGPLN